MNTSAGRRRRPGLSPVDVNGLVQWISLRPLVLGPLLLPGDASKLGPRTWGVEEGVGRRTSQDGPWLHAGWKSNMSQQKVKVEFIEEREREREREDRSVWKTGKEKEQESHLCSESGVFTEDSGLMYVSSQTSRNQLEQR